MEAREATPVELSPGAVRRRLAGDGARVLESTVVFHRLPGVVLQWELETGTEIGTGEGTGTGTGTETGKGTGTRTRTGEVALHLGWSVPPEARTELPEGPTGPLILHFVAEADADADDGVDSTVRVELADGGGRWTVESRGDVAGTDSTRGITRISLHASLEEGDPLTLLFSLDSGDERQRSAVVRRISNLRAELEAWAAADARAAGTELSLSIGDPRTAEAFQWERRRLHGTVGHTGAGDVVLLDSGPSASVGTRLGRAGHGLLALGRHREAGELVGRAVPLLVEGLDADPSPDRETEAANLLLLLGRYVLWTGDPRPLRTVGEDLERWFARLKEHGVAPGAPSSRSSHFPRSSGSSRSSIGPAAVEAALHECAEAVEAAGDRARAEALRDGGDGSGLQVINGRTAGTEPPSGAALRDPPGPESGEKSDVPSSRSTDATGNAHGAGLPGRNGGAIDPAILLFDLLGARADAFFGRLQLAPRFPDAWRRATVGGIRMGEARVRLAYHVQGGRHTFRLEPTGGRVPVNLVFEPLLPVTGLEGAWVDGSPADVERFRRGERVGARLQIPLDAPREVVFEEPRAWT